MKSYTIYVILLYEQAKRKDRKAILRRTSYVSLIINMLIS